ncbi:MAG TPA: nickel insertion protein, partial [Candidatus Deferrimicrobium sp.]|nr:nickel insertion protein [Candidatus Deferrimicrobium sp.]
LSVLDALDIKYIYLTPLAVGTDLRTLRLQEGQTVTFSEKATSASFAALAKKLGKRFDSSRDIILKTAAKSKSGLTAYLFTFEDAQKDNVTVIQFQVDDMNPEILGYLQERAFEVGALDYFTTPIQMKKNRPGTLVTILCQPDVKDSFIDLILEETSSIGVRYHQETRSKAERYLTSVDTSYGTVRVKISSWTDSGGKTCTQYSPEYEDCKELARTNKIPLKRIYELALQQIKVRQ